MIRRLSRMLRRLWNSTAGAPATWFVDWLRGETASDSGVSIDGKSCLRYAPVWHAVNRICGRVAQLPLVVYQWEDADQRTKRRAIEHPAYRLLRRRPNRAMNASTFKELVQYHALVWGNGRAEIVRDRRGEPVALVPLLPDRTKTVLVNGEKWHVTEVVVDSETQRTELRKIRDENCLHIPGLGYDGVAGYALWELAKNSWGLGLGQEKRANRFYRNNAVPGLILEAPAGVFRSDEEAKKFLAAFREMHEGLENTSRTALLREGVKASKLSQTDQEAQTIEQRRFQRQDVALWFLLESILGDDSSVSYNSLEQKHLAELINCLNPWLVKWQEECEEKLLREREKAADTHFVRFSTGALLRSDTKTTYQMLTLGVRGMILTINEAREILDLPPVEGGDELKNPAITPGRAAGGGGGDQARERLRAVVRARLDDLLGVERRRVVEMASRPNDRRAWYARWRKTLAEAWRPLAAPGVDVERLARDWCALAQEELDGIDTAADPSRLNDLIGAWGWRVDVWTDELLGRQIADRKADTKTDT